MKRHEFGKLCRQIAIDIIGKEEDDNFFDIGKRKDLAEFSRRLADKLFEPGDEHDQRFSG